MYLAFPDWPSGAPNNANGEGSAQSPAQGGGRAFPSYESNQHTGLVQTSPSTHHHLGCDSDALAKHNGLYDMDADGEPLDVAIQVGRLSITEKIGGFFRPHVASQLDALLSDTDHTARPYIPQTAYGASMIQRPTHLGAASTLALVKRVLPLEPSSGFLTTASQSFLPQPGLELPTGEELTLLYYQYWSAVDPLAHIIHRPSFERECRKYLLHSQVIDAAPVSFKALLLAMCLAAAVSLPSMQAEEVLGVTQQTLVGRLKIATERALTDANAMSSVNVQTLQAFTVYLIPQYRAEISRSHTVYVGTLIRLAMSAGLNRDSSNPSMDPVEGQVRRLLWHQICFLDLLTTEAQGPQPVIRDGSFDTTLPLNINDDALDWPDNKSVPTSGWTDATFSIIQYECCIVIRLIYAQRLAIENGQTDLKTARKKVGEQEARIERKYLHHLDKAIPIQRCAKLVGRLFTARFDAMLLHQHWQMDVKSESQMNIRETLVESCLAVCECAVALDTDPDLAPWAWYARAFQQYHGSIYLLMEVYREPSTRHADRINQVLDHVFEATPHLSSTERSRNLLQLLAEELDKMTQLRKVKHSQFTVSDNGSSSPNDHTGMAKTPEDGQHWNHWQPEVMYPQAYRHNLPPMSDEGWWPIPVQHGMLCDSTVPEHHGYTGPQHHDYGYGMGSGPM